MSADGTHQGTGLQRRQDGSTALPSGGALDIESGAALKIAGTDVTAKVAALPSPAILGALGATPVAGVAAGYKVARGVAAITGSGTVVTGLATVVSVVVSPVSDLDGDTFAGCSGTIGDQAGAPAAGSVILKCWKNNADGDATMVAADAPKNVAWIAVGT